MQNVFRDMLAARSSQAEAGLAASAGLLPSAALGFHEVEFMVEGIVTLLGTVSKAFNPRIKSTTWREIRYSAIPGEGQLPAELDEVRPRESC